MVKKLKLSIPKKKGYFRYFIRDLNKQNINPITVQLKETEMETQL